MISNSIFNLPEIDSLEMLKDAPYQSAAQELGKKIQLSPTGNIVKSVSDIEAFGIGEGKEKIASGTGTSIVIGPNKSVSVVVETEEAFALDGRLADVIADEQPSAHAKKFDQIVMGLAAVPTDWSNFATFANLTAVELTAGTDSSVSFDDALAQVIDGDVNALFTTTAFIQWLKRQRIAQTGAKAFDISGDNKRGFVNGIPFASVPSTTAVAVAGNFEDRYLWGATNVLHEGTFIKDAGSITDDQGVVHNLTSENKIGLFNEILFGSGIGGTDYFVKMTPEAS